MRKLIVLILVALGLLMVTPAVASASTPTLKSLAKTVAALQKRVNTQKVQIKALKTELASAQPVLALAPYVSVTSDTMNGVIGPNIVFKGANVHIQSTSSESDTSGLGNLIIGYDGPPTSPPAGYRDGSNNLIVGGENAFSSYGCFVAGMHNTVSGPWASVSGGTYNVANTYWASVSGGDSNLASGQRASVGGGYHNTASGGCSSVSGGSLLTESYQYGWAGGEYESN